jgi:putative SOS response-associated peptidase YedK
MCSSISWGIPAADLTDAFGLDYPPPTVEAKDFFPKQLVAVVGSRKDKSRGVSLFNWGLLPNWYASRDQEPRPFNARVETVRTYQLFRDLVPRKRCIVPASGFYEWGTDDKGKKHRHEFRLRSGPLAMAGLWDVWGTGPESVPSCCILTTGPNAVVAPVHARMPVLLQPQDYAAWLDADTDQAEVDRLMRTPFPAELMTSEAKPLKPVKAVRQVKPDLFSSVG